MQCLHVLSANTRKNAMDRKYQNSRTPARQRMLTLLRTAPACPAVASLRRRILGRSNSNHQAALPLYNAGTGFPSSIASRRSAAKTQSFDVQSSMFDVPCSGKFMVKALFKYPVQSSPAPLHDEAPQP